MELKKHLRDRSPSESCAFAIGGSRVDTSARLVRHPASGPRPGYASSNACLSHARNSASTSAGVANGISKCQRLPEVCSALRTRELVTFLAALSVRIKLVLRVATPANAEERTR